MEKTVLSSKYFLSGETTGCGSGNTVLYREKNEKQKGEKSLDGKMVDEKLSAHLVYSSTRTGVEVLISTVRHVLAIDNHKGYSIYFSLTTSLADTGQTFATLAHCSCIDLLFFLYIYHLKSLIKIEAPRLTCK